MTSIVRIVMTWWSNRQAHGQRIEIIFWFDVCVVNKKSAYNTRNIMLNIEIVDEQLARFFFCSEKLSMLFWCTRTHRFRLAAAITELFFYLINDNCWRIVASQVSTLCNGLIATSYELPFNWCAIGGPSNLYENNCKILNVIWSFSVLNWISTIGGFFAETSLSFCVWPIA